MSNFPSTIELPSQSKQPQQLTSQTPTCHRSPWDDDSDADEQQSFLATKSNEFLCSRLAQGLFLPCLVFVSVTLLVAVLIGVYQLGRNEGSQRESSLIGEEPKVSTTTTTNTLLDNNPNEFYQSISGAFTRDHLHQTRVAAKELIKMLHEYYGGEIVAKDMLARSWQAAWDLDVNLFLNKEDVEDSEESVGAENSKEDSDDSDHSDDNDDDDKNDDADSDDSDDNDDDADGEERSRVRTLTKTNKIMAKTAVNTLETITVEEKNLYHQSSRKRTTKLITTMARALLDPNQNNFIIGTIGSSVAAGHDNCHYDCYESQLERTLQGVFSAANMKLIVQNAGEGGGCGDTHQNQVFCITHNVSPNVDIIHYSWTYFEKGGAEEQREQLIRWGQTMKRRPMVHHLVARGKPTTCEGDSLANVQLDTAYAAYGYNAFCIQTGLYFGGHDYEFEKENGLDRFGWQKVGDGYHYTTRYGESLPMDHPRRESLGTVFRNWHPGPLGFQIAADAFSYVYGMGILLALDIIEADLNSGLDVLDRWFDTSKSRMQERDEIPKDADDGNEDTGKTLLLEFPARDDLSEPLFCDPLYCSIPNAPSCLNFEKPTFGVPGVVIKSQANWILWKEDNKWSYMVGKVDSAIIKSMKDPEWEEKCSHLDACGGVYAKNASHGELVFELPSSKMFSGVVIVCGCCGKKVGESMFLLNSQLVIKLNGHVLDKVSMDVYPNSKCVRIVKGFDQAGYEKEEKMLLSFELSGEPNEQVQEVKISHVIAL